MAALAICAAAGVGRAETSQIESSRRPFTAADIFALKTVSDAEISPDGRQIVFVQKANDIQSDRHVTSLWLLETAGGAPRHIVADASTPRWSPDGGRIAYLGADGSGATQIQVLNPRTGATAQITHVSGAPDALAWSPDGRLIAFTAFVPEPAQTLGAPLEKPPGATWAEPPRFTSAKHYVADGSGDVAPGHTHLFVVPADGGAVRQITFGPRDDADPAWSPDGRDLVFSSKDVAAQLVDFAADRIHQVDLVTGKDTRLSPEPIAASSPTVSPDGKLVAFVGFAERKPGDFFPIDIYVMDRDGSHAHVLAPSLDRVTVDPRWTADGRAVLAHYADHGVDTLARLGLDGSVRVLARGLTDSYSVSRDGVLAFPLGGSDHPSDVGVATAEGSRRLTRLNDGVLDTLALGAVAPLAVRSSLDGAQVGAWVVLPPGYDRARRYPTILEIHGGPYGEDDPEWRTDSQVFAAAGYVVLYANYRGSTSYGLKFSTAIDRDFPGPAYDDLMSAVDAAVAAGVADPSRLFVTGGSAGGELTAWIIGRTHRFRAAVAAKPVIDLISESLVSDQYLNDATTEYATTPWASPMTFWSHSPLSLVANVTTPTLLIVGEEDRRTPLGQSMEFYDALQIRGVPTGLLRVPGASHEGLESRPSQQAAEDIATLAWFARYGGPAAR